MNTVLPDSGGTPQATIVICTYARPEPLAHLLLSIARQETTISYELIVVDNDPASGSLDGLKATFEHVTWIQESRQGLSFARNAGIRAARSEIVVFADDDMEVFPGWLDALLSPMLTQGFDLVLGPVVPSKIENTAEQLFEAYGGHGHERSSASYDGTWLRNRRWCLPLWQVGIVGNSAIRRSLFYAANVGLFDEALGVGTPAGSCEDLYFLYLLLRANRRVLREPAASVKHAHRETMDGLAKQLCGYRRGEVCFCLLVLFRHGDVRGVTHLCLWIAPWRARLFLEEIARRLRGRHLFPFRLMFQEVAAYSSGPGALIASLRRAARLRKRWEF